jgi:hypothetical protein
VIQDEGDSPPLVCPIVCHGFLKEASRCVIEITFDIHVNDPFDAMPALLNAR